MGENCIARRIQSSPLDTSKYLRVAKYALKMPTLNQSATSPDAMSENPSEMINANFMSTTQCVT